MARPKLGNGETERLHMLLTAEEVTAIDDWRYGNRVASRSEAVRRLIQIGRRADASLGQQSEQLAALLNRLISRSEVVGVMNLAGNKQDAVNLSIKVFTDLTEPLAQLLNEIAALENEVAALRTGEEVQQSIALAEEVRAAAKIRAQEMLKRREEFEAAEKEHQK